MTFSDSMPRSLTIFTAMQRLSPGAKGSETVPWNCPSSVSSSSARMSFFSLYQPSLSPALPVHQYSLGKQRIPQVRVVGFRQRRVGGSGELVLQTGIADGAAIDRDEGEESRRRESD